MYISGLSMSLCVLYVDIFLSRPIFSVAYKLSEVSTLKFFMICEAKIGVPTAVFYTAARLILLKI